jgi:amino acid transporter
MVLAFTLTGGNVNRYFEAVLGLTVSMTTISHMFIFPAFVRLRYERPDVERPYRVPGGMAIAWILSALTTLWALLATVALIWPGFGVDWFGLHANPNGALTALSFSHERFQNELSQVVPLIVLVAMGVVFYLVGDQNARADCGRVARIGRDGARGRHRGGCGVILFAGGAMGAAR